MKNKNKRKGFSLVELVVIIGILALLVAVVAPMLLRYIHTSRAQKDDSAMDEVVRAVRISLADDKIYDEMISWACLNNVACYIDKETEMACGEDQIVITRNTGVKATTEYMFNNTTRVKDEFVYYAAGKMKGATITFHPEHDDSGNSYFHLQNGIINQFMLLKGKIIDTKDFYGRLVSTVGEKIYLQSSQYKNSEYTVFIRFGTATAGDQEALKATTVYGQWNGTNLSEGGLSFNVAGERDVNIDVENDNPYLDNDDKIYTSEDLKNEGFDVSEEDLGEGNLMIKPNGGSWNEKTGISFVTVGVFEEYKIQNAKMPKKTFAGWSLSGSGWLGYKLDTQPTDFSTRNHLGIYNNESNGNVKHAVVGAGEAGGNPFGSPNVLKITSSGRTSPGRGGFVHSTNSAASQTFLHVFTAKVPVGVTLQYANNSVGTGAAFTWVTSRGGTGEWQTYAYTLRCGASGTFSNFGYVYASGGSDPLTWYVADSKMYNITETKNINRDLYIGYEGMGTITANWGVQVGNGIMPESSASTFLIAGPDFNDRIHKNAERIVFTDIKAPKDKTVIDLSLDLDGGVVSWFDSFDNTFYVSSQRAGVKIKAHTSCANMFAHCANITEIDFSNLDTSGVTSMSSMFFGCSGLTELDLSSWNTSKVTDMSSMFARCTKLSTLDVGHFKTDCVVTTAAMFEKCSKLTEINVKNWNVGLVSSFTSMFSGCSGVTKLEVDNWNMGSARAINNIFSGCSKLTSVNVSKWNVSKVTNFDATFQSCSKLTTVDVSKWDTSSATSMYGMFNGCSGLTSLDVSDFNVAKVTNVRYMFSNCSKLTTIDVSKWSVSKVTNAEYMFNGCQKVTTLDTSLWVANSLNNIRYMFNNCYELQKLDLSGFNTKNVTYLNNMLDGCRKLKELKLGSNFKFEGNGVSRLTLPTPNTTYIPGATGKWYSKTTGTAYAPSAVPTLRADTYVAVP